MQLHIINLIISPNFWDNLKARSKTRNLEKCVPIRLFRSRVKKCLSCKSDNLPWQSGWKPSKEIHLWFSVPGDWERLQLRDDHVHYGQCRHVQSVLEGEKLSRRQQCTTNFSYKIGHDLSKTNWTEMPLLILFLKQWGELIKNAKVAQQMC